MRTALISLLIILATVVAYAYVRNPSGCEKVFNDARSLAISVSPIPVHPDAGTQNPDAPAPASVSAVPNPPPSSQASVPAPAAPAPANPSASAFKPWAPPDVMPAQPNWTWTTSDGKTYQDVVVTKIDPDTATITHSMGVAHVPIFTLPPDILKKLGYDPAAAAAAHAESERESAHPYYTMVSLAEAQGVARQMHWPLAWVSSRKEDIMSPNPAQDDEIALTTMALDHLKDKSIIIFINAETEMGQTPAIVHHQFSQFDDGTLPGGANYTPPKVVFSNPDATNIFGRVSYTQMKASGALAIDEVLASVPKDTQSSSNGQTASAPPSPPSSPASVPAPGPAAAPAAPAPAHPLASTFKPWAPPDVMPSQPNWTWTTSDGKTYQDVVVTKIEAGTVTITHSMGVAHIPLSLLAPDIQKQLNYDPHAASQLAAFLNGELISADGTAVSAPGPSVQYYAIYYSAQWCPPCHAFTPRLVKWYNAFKPSHPNFELIFVSDDHSKDSMFAYMKEMAMPWPAFQFDDLKHDGKGIEKFAGSGIPDLVLVDASGKVLSDSFIFGAYIGPEAVVAAINKLVGGASPVPLAQQTPSAPAARTALVSARD